MGLKYGGVRYRLTGDAKDKNAVFAMLDLLDLYHGQATGIFTCDEHLAGRSPSQGTELCTVVEAMYSLEVLAGIVGDPRLGDRLEQLAFNALPATFKKDMTAHQYDQQCNQVICRPRANMFTSVTALTRISTDSSRTSAAARLTCTRDGPSLPRTSG